MHTQEIKCEHQVGTFRNRLPQTARKPHKNINNRYKEEKSENVSRGKSLLG
jgi:hypothetical protein